MDDIRVYWEGGINWCIYTKLAVYPDKTVAIIKHWREHKGDKSSIDAGLATPHPAYYSSSIWKTNEYRIALEYHVPRIGWCKIRNQQNISDYHMITIPVTIMDDPIPAILTE